MNKSAFEIASKYPDFDPAFWPLYERVRAYTMTSPPRLYDLWQSVRYIVKADIPGVLLETGVWKGGSSMLMALTLRQLEQRREVVLFDTFEGLPPPDAELDVDFMDGAAAERYREGWIAVSQDEVKAAMTSTGYPYFLLVRGRVERTVPEWIKSFAPIALARIDTDWYASTKVELETLWPALEPGGLLIIDDYGHWKGCRKAVDEYFADRPVKMHRIDYACRVIQK